MHYRPSVSEAGSYGTRIQGADVIEGKDRAYKQIYSSIA